MSRLSRQIRFPSILHLAAVSILTAFITTTIVASAFAQEASRPAIFFADFEGADYGDWVAEGDAFGTAPVCGYKSGGMGSVFGFHGEKLANSYVPNGDGATGTLTSPEFMIERNFIVFHIGGGAFPGETGVNLMIDGKTVRTSTGLFNQPLVGHEGLEPCVWDVKEFQGQKAQIVIFDKKAGGDWGHVKVDHFYQTDETIPGGANSIALLRETKPVEYNRMIFGQFIEHFHRQVYGGIFEPGSPLSDELGLRKDVVEALRELRVPIVRWPGGCFVSAYHWINGTGAERQPYFDKAWHVEDPNTFGTAEYVKWCRLIGAEPYICTNAGTGTPEEMSDWVEYCNLNVGKYGRKRIADGDPEPFNVQYWSVGNENWGGHEMGAKTVEEWGPLVRESSKLIINTDPNIKLLAAALPNENWTIPLLKTAGNWLDYVSIHGYWSWIDKNKKPAPYIRCMMLTTRPEQDMLHTIDMLEQTGFRGRIKIAFDEWNLRGWHHPGIGNPRYLDLDARKLNDDNSVYTMADALFAACFLNSCLRRCEDVTMACFSPIVNVRGALYVYPEGLVRRTTFYVFKLYSDLLEKNYLPVEFAAEPLISGNQSTPKVDVALTCDDAKERFTLVVVNKDPENAVPIALNLEKIVGKSLDEIKTTILQGDSPDSYNDVGNEFAVVPEETTLKVVDGKVAIPPHALCFLQFQK